MLLFSLWTEGSKPYWQLVEEEFGDVNRNSQIKQILKMGKARSMASDEHLPIRYWLVSTACINLYFLIVCENYNTKNHRRSCLETTKIDLTFYIGGCTKLIFFNLCNFFFTSNPHRWLWKGRREYGSWRDPYL